MKINDVCPYCKNGKLVFVKSCEPYTVPHLQCENCDSTYIISGDDDEDKD